jgi:hypothetical protein
VRLLCELGGSAVAIMRALSSPEGRQETEVLARDAEDGLMTDTHLQALYDRAPVLAVYVPIESSAPAAVLEKRFSTWDPTAPMVSPGKHWGRPQRGYQCSRRCSLCSAPGHNVRTCMRHQQGSYR